MSLKYEPLLLASLEIKPRLERYKEEEGRGGTSSWARAQVNSERLRGMTSLRLSFSSSLLLSSPELSDIKEYGP